MTFCVTCESLKDQLKHQDAIIDTLEQEARQQHARNKRLQEEIAYAERIIGEYREADANRKFSPSYNQVRESFSR